MARFNHFVKSNHSSETIHHCIFLDCETEQIKVSSNEVRHKLSFGWVCYQRRDDRLHWRKPEWLRFTTEDELYGFITSKLQSKIKLYIFCHNSNFDYPVLRLFEWFTSIGAILNMAVISGPPTIMRYRIKDSTAILLDTLNIWRMPLEALGKIVGIDKLSMPGKTASKEQWDEYGRRDVEIIRKAVTEWADFLIDNDFGGFSPTLAGQSMRLFRHRFLTTDIAIHDNEQALELERNCYHGGRNEAYFIGKRRGKYTLLDVNSMYPFVMAKYNYPTKLHRLVEQVNIDALSQLMVKYSVCGHFRITTDKPAYPYRQQGKLIFPIGTFDCYLTTPEIEYAIAHNHIQHCYQLALYEHAPIFKEFVTYLYEKRLQADNAEDPLDGYSYKILLNSHYGKWGQNGYKTIKLGRQQFEAYRTFEVIDGETGKVIKYRQLGYDLEMTVVEGSSREAFPAIAAHVTSYARMYLYNLVSLAGHSNVFYIDTDSLLVNAAGAHQLESFRSDSELGGLKVEGCYNEIEIYGCKDYRFGTKERHKGIKRKARWITSNSAEQEQWQNLKGILREGRLNDPHTKTIVKTLHRNYTKGNVDNNGLVRPISL